MSNTVAPVIGYGGRLYLDPLNGSSYSELTPVVNVKLPDVDVPKVDSTPLNAANALKTYIPGLVDHTSLVFELQYGESTFQTITNQAFTRATGAWKFTTASANETFTFSGFVTKCESPEFKVEDLVTFKCEVCLTTAITMNYGGSTTATL